MVNGRVAVTESFESVAVMVSVDVALWLVIVIDVWSLLPRYGQTTTGAIVRRGGLQ